MDACDDTDRLPVDGMISAATKAKEIETDKQRVVKHSLTELVALDKHLTSRRAACQVGGNAWGMVAKSRVVPPSAVGEERPENET